LKKGNKKIGAYYTPEEVTDYISRNTILPNLFDKLGIADKDNFDAFLNQSNNKTIEKALNQLKEIKLCDPACGSGAFIIKAGEVLLEYQEKILRRLGKSNINKYSLKKDIIINNLYGVDIQENAVEICKLRIWLWLISSTAKAVEPLPNIEYNFVVGNSLVGWSQEKLSQSILITVDEKQIRPLITLKTGMNLNKEKYR
jgi:hypothetical protein